MVMMSTRLQILAIGLVPFWLCVQLSVPPNALAREDTYSTEEAPIPLLSYPVGGEVWIDLSNHLADLDLMARTLWGEARSQSDEEVLAIASVIINRWIDGRYGASISDVIKDPFQFSCWNKSDPNRPKMLGLQMDDPGYTRMFYLGMRVLAERLWYGNSMDYAKGARHYHHDANPDWAEKALSEFSIGDGKFYVLATR